MSTVVLFYVILVLIFPYSLAFYDEESIFNANQNCAIQDDPCQTMDDCCSNLICSMVEGQSRCVPEENLIKRRENEDTNRINYPQSKFQSSMSSIGKQIAPVLLGQNNDENYLKLYQRNKMEWSNCQFHEDCGEGYCCYAHFRFRSLPKSFCRPNRNIHNYLCDPLTKYRTLQSASPWRKQLQNYRVLSLPILHRQR